MGPRGPPEGLLETQGAFDCNAAGEIGQTVKYASSPIETSWGPRSQAHDPYTFHQ